ncbi:Conserved_hypothetical protein [Hexamita inflata]|uniref:Uncharacterized protein n=1 Tax=Hexamita inflata TaxID=28002 RepID=A0AA86QTB9_9EUKA|nr:Conserved hypothetical protein [Hexamita inflata]
MHPKFDRLSVCKGTTAFVTLFVLSLAAITLFSIQYSSGNQVVSVSTTQCPPSAKLYDPYFCMGVDMSNYSPSNNQGLPDGFVVRLGPFNKYNVDFKMHLNLIAKTSGLSDLSLNVKLFGGNDEQSFTQIGEYVNKSQLQLASSHKLQIVNKTVVYYTYLKLVITEMTSTQALSEVFVETTTKSEAYGKTQLILKFICIVLSLVFTAGSIINIKLNNIQVKHIPNITRQVINLALFLPLFVSPLVLLSMEVPVQPVIVFQSFFKCGFIGIATALVTAVTTYALAKVTEKGFQEVGENPKPAKKFWYQPPRMSKAIGTLAFAVCFANELVASMVIFQRTSQETSQIVLAIVSGLFVLLLAVAYSVIAYKIIKYALVQKQNILTELTSPISSNFDDPELLQDQNKMSWSPKFMMFVGIYPLVFALSVIGIICFEVASIGDAPSMLSGFDIAFLLIVMFFAYFVWPSSKKHGKSKQMVSERNDLLV